MFIVSRLHSIETLEPFYKGEIQGYHCLQCSPLALYFTTIKFCIGTVIGNLIDIEISIKVQDFITKSVFSYCRFQWVVTYV